MLFSRFIAGRLAFSSQKTFTRLIVRLALAGIALSVAVMIVSQAIVLGYKNKITEKITGFSGHIELHGTGSSGHFDYYFFNDSLPLRDKIKKLPSVTSMSAVIQKPGILKTGEEMEGIVFKGVENNYNWDFLKENIVSGLLDDSLEKREVVISSHLAKRLKIKPGDNVQVFFILEHVRVIPCRVKAVYETGLEGTDQLMVVGHISELQRIFANRKPEITHYEINLKDLSQLEASTKEIDKLVPHELTAESIKTLNPQMFDWLGYLDQNMVIIISLMAVVACINMITALLILILDRTNMIGVLKALGSRNSLIKHIFIYYGVIIIGGGIIAGNILGLSLCFLQEQFSIITLPQETYYLSVVPVEINFGFIATLNLATLIVCTLALFLPAGLVSRISPVKALKFD